MSGLVLLVFVAIAFIIVGVVLAVAFAVGRTRSATTPDAVQSALVSVVGVREITVGDRTQHWVGLRFTDGHEREFLATASQARVIVRGRSGTAHFAGDRLTGWVPEIGGIQDSHRSE